MSDLATYRLRCLYTQELELIVRGAPDADMSDPDNWDEIVKGSECDHYLDNVKSSTRLDETNAIH